MLTSVIIANSAIAHQGVSHIMTFMNGQITSILMILSILIAGTCPFSQDLFCPSSQKNTHESDEIHFGQSHDKTSSNVPDKESEPSSSSTQGEVLRSIVVETPGRVLRLFPVSRLFKSSIICPAIPTAQVHPMDVRIIRVMVLDRCISRSLAIVAPPVQSHAPPAMV